VRDLVGALDADAEGGAELAQAVVDAALEERAAALQQAVDDAVRRAEDVLVGNLDNRSQLPSDSHRTQHVSPCRR
jgi:hypothetical protein